MYETIYTSYAPETDTTVIFKETKTYSGKFIVEVIGFYYGEPNKELTELYSGKLTAIIES